MQQGRLREHVCGKGHRQKVINYPDTRFRTTPGQERSEGFQSKGTTEQP